MSAYFDALCEAMSLCAAQPRAIFMGQAVGCEGTAMYHTLKHIDPEKRLELPVMEDAQLGMATGMAINGDLPICIYPRWNFLLLATNQLVLHLDKLPIYSHGGYNPRVIIRTAVATHVPLDPQAQHVGDFSAEYKAMLRRVEVIRLWDAEQIVPAYREALKRNGSTILVEFSGEYA